MATRSSRSSPNADFDELMRFEVDADFLQHGIGQTLRANEYDGLERVGLRAQVGTLSGGEFKILAREIWDSTSGELKITSGELKIN